MLKSLTVNFDNLAFFVLLVFWPLSQYMNDILRLPFSHLAFSAYLLATLLLLPGAKHLLFSAFFLHNHRNMLAVLLLLWLVAVAIAQYPGLYQAVGAMALKIVGIDFSLPIIYFFLGLSVRKVYAGKTYCNFIIALCVTYAVFSLYAWEAYANTDSFLRNRLHAYGILVSYQSLGDALAILGIGLFTNADALKWLGLAAILAIMFVVNSWGALLAFACCVAIYTMFNNRRHFYLLLLMSVTVSIVFFNKLYFIVFNLWETSVANRAALLQYRLEHLPNLIFGTYHIEILEGRTGYYLHNILAFAEQYGMIFFLGYAYLFINLLFATARRRETDPLSAYAFYCLSYSLISLLCFRDCFYPISWFSMGVSLVSIHHAEAYNSNGWRTICKS